MDTSIFYLINTVRFICRLVLENLDKTNNEEIQEKLEAVVQEALDDETYRKVKRMSYQSHVADEVRKHKSIMNSEFTDIGVVKLGVVKLKECLLGFGHDSSYRN